MITNLSVRMTPCNSFQESEWVENLRRGNRPAFEALFRRYYEELCIFSLQIVRDPEVAEDLVQDLFVRIWEQRASLNPQGSSRGYLFTATRNRSLNYLKHKQVEQNWMIEATQTPLEEGDRPDSDLQYHETVVAFERVLNALPEGQRTVFLLSRRHEMTYAEIAALLGVSIKTVETQMGRALRRLREDFSEYLDSIS